MTSPTQGPSSSTSQSDAASLNQSMHSTKGKITPVGVDSSLTVPILPEETTLANVGGFFPSEDQHQLILAAREFAKDIIRPVAMELEYNHQFPHEVIKQAHQLGLLNISVPEYLGGLGASASTVARITEECAWGCGGVATSLLANDLALQPLLIAATEEQKLRLVKPLVESGKLAAFCLTEPQGGSNVAGLQTTATRDGDFYVLNGSKQWITNGAESDLLTVFARVPGTQNHAGISCFAVDAKSEGVSFGRPERKLGQNASHTVSVSFENVRVPVNNLIGQEGKAFAVAMQTLDFTRPMVAMLSVGIARAGFEEAKEYAKNREAFGQPIIGFDAIKTHLVDMYSDIMKTRLLALQSAAIFDLGLKREGGFFASVAKYDAGDMVRRVTDQAMQIHGGYGYSSEYLVSKLVRDARLIGVYEGTTEIQRKIIGEGLSRM